jgi:TRAP-type mannitol/chloroaromatic compound transport system permease small subunit
MFAARDRGQIPLIIAPTPRDAAHNERRVPQPAPRAIVATAAADPYGGIVNALLAFSRTVDWINEAVGKTTIWLILIVVLISAGNAVFRYAFDWSSNGLLEVQWYMFSAIFLLCAGYVLKKNEHIRIDVIAGRMSARAQNWIDVFGIVAFLLPMVLMTMYLGWEVFVNAWVSGETSPNPGGLVRWPVRLLLPVGFFLLLLQGLSELVKRLAFLTGRGPNVLDKHKGPTPEELLAEEIRKRQVAEEVVEAVEASAEMIDNKQGVRK